MCLCASDTLQHGQGVDERGDQSKDLSTGQRLDADGSALAVGGGVGGSGRQSNSEAGASVKEGGVGHHGIHLGNLLLDLSLELGDLLSVALQLVALEKKDDVSTGDLSKVTDLICFSRLTKAVELAASACSLTSLAIDLQVALV